VSVRKEIIIEKYNDISVKGNVENNYLTTNVEEGKKFTTHISHRHTNTNIVTGLRSWNHIDVERRSLLINVTVNAYPQQ
jgi:hypothetical protein